MYECGMKTAGCQIDNFYRDVDGGVCSCLAVRLMPEHVALDPGSALRLSGMATGGVRPLWRAGRSKPADSQAGLFPPKGYFIHHPPAHNKGLVRFMHEDGMRQLLCQTGSFDRDVDDGG
ncbi:hypothetical protein SAMN04488518_101565 [Pseudovibrio ascidiaceicola]|uniref:Uncharacterized protein n=1 Tax=Pseudovibrio ascidiaceicola TaxID=285279 RepID=A0A1I3VQI7_9HYPH|nr:hypothetical protein SAMN04488518_101565 [Pseudovibrio ascidiaceicola]